MWVKRWRPLQARRASKPRRHSKREKGHREGDEERPRGGSSAIKRNGLQMQEGQRQGHARRLPARQDALLNKARGTSASPGVVAAVGQRGGRCAHAFENGLATWQARWPHGNTLASRCLWDARHRAMRHGERGSASSSGGHLPLLLLRHWGQATRGLQCRHTCFILPVKVQGGGRAGSAHGRAHRPAPAIRVLR